MADDWKLCADWLVRCEVLAPEHPAARPTGQLQNLAAVLRDGVLICILLNRLHPDAIDPTEFSPHPQVSLFLCRKNVKSFLQACKTVFDLKDRDLFEHSDLVEIAEFGKVIRTLSKLSQTPLALKTGIAPFHVSDQRCPSQSEYSNALEFSRGDDDDSDVDDYCNYSLPAAVVMRDDVYGRLVDFKSSVSPKSKESKSQKDLCIDELVNTEKKFVEALQMIREKFMASLNSVMAPNDFDTVFKHIEQLHGVHSHFYQQLCKAISKERSLTVGDCFLTCKENFLVHGDYCSNLLNAQELIDRLYHNSPTFKTRLKQCQMVANEARLQLRDLLALPMQRVLKYHLFLKELIKQSKNEEDSGEKRSLQHALKEIEDLSLFVNEVKRDNETLLAIRSLQKSIVGGGPLQQTNTELKNYGRLVMDGELKVKTDGENSPKTRHVFLLDKLVLICKSAGELNRFKKCLLLLDTQLDDTLSTGKGTLSFSLKSASSLCTFTAKTMDSRRKWINAIKMAKDNICPKFAQAGGHNFVMQSFECPTICDVCRKLLRGVFYQGYKCRNTGMSVHKECLEKAKDMSGPPTPVHRESTALRRVTLLSSVSHDVVSPPKPCSSSRTTRSHSLATVNPHVLPLKLPRAASVTLEDLQQYTAASADYVNELASAPWYADAMSREDAEQVLQHRPNGTFLIRQSINPSRRGELTLSVKYNDVLHAVIDRRLDGRVGFKKDVTFGSIIDLVEHYRSHSLHSVYKEVGTALLHPFKQTEAAGAQRMQQNFIGYCHATFDFAPTAPNQISMREGDRIGIISKGGEGRGWWKGRNGNQVGYFPYAYVTEDE